uniref:7TM_GPCR_Srx domain-containing protein n=1 Tax=Rhabditophanes sp. KR3021 TaxID=114890 RepID=A0AC35U9S7_9BILA
MNSFHDVFMVIGGTIGVLLNLSAFVLMSTYTCTKYCHFKAIIKYLRLVDGLGAVMLGIMVEGQFIPGVNLVSSHGVCQRLNSDVCAKITYATCVNVTLIIIGSVTFMNLMRYNVFFRKAELLTTSTYDKIIFSCVMIIGPIGVFATCYDLQIYKENDVSSFQLDASDLEDVRHYFGPEYTLLGIFTTNKLNISKKSDSFKKLIRFGKLIESLTPFFLGVVCNSKSISSFTVTSCKGLCHSFGIPLACKLGLLLSMVSVNFIVGLLSIACLWRYNVFVRKVKYSKLEIPDIIFLSCCFFIGPLPQLITVSGMGTLDEDFVPMNEKVTS